MLSIVEICQQKVFSHDEVNQILPLIYRLTEEVSKEVRLLVQCLETLPDKTSDRALEIEARVDRYIHNWQGKIKRLGGHPKGLWLVDFDNGNGYYCWKFPETKVSYVHGYKDGFSGRKLLEGELPNDQNSDRPD